MRPDKFGNYDGAHGLPRKQYVSFQAEYDAHYDRAVELLRQGVTPRQILHFDPDLDRPISDYLRVGEV